MRPWSRNPLMRGSDRCESVLRAALVVLVVLMLPVAGAIGTVTYTHSAAVIEADNAAMTQVPATVTGKASLASAVTPYRQDHYETPVQWTRDDTGVTGTATLDAPTPVGSVVTVWLGRDGKPGDGPVNPESAAFEGIGTGLTVWLLTCVIGIGLLCCVDLVLTVVRNLGWEAEWRHLSPAIET
ncbi:Rv1733c family protein [Nocardia sp. CA-151230]|uniref:Rv1733c family protein n=1 Tax=Nocardia sp. CA-151230 TaxID=3239982 RepID=UPI003D8D9F5D